jgi:hypothetical protein
VPCLASILLEDKIRNMMVGKYFSFFMGKMISMLQGLSLRNWRTSVDIISLLIGIE